MKMDIPSNDLKGYREQEESVRAKVLAEVTSLVEYAHSCELPDIAINHVTDRAEVRSGNVLVGIVILGYCESLDSKITVSMHRRSQDQLSLVSDSDDDVARDLDDAWLADAYNKYRHG